MPCVFLNNFLGDLMSSSFIFATNYLALAVAAVVGRSLNIQSHVYQPQLLHTSLHGLHHGLSLLPPKAMNVDPKSLTLDTVQDDEFDVVQIG